MQQIEFKILLLLILSFKFFSLPSDFIYKPILTKSQILYD